MKIQANMTTYHFSENTKVAQGKQTIKESLPNLAEQSIKVSISKEDIKNTGTVYLKIVPLMMW